MEKKISLVKLIVFFPLFLVFCAASYADPIGNWHLRLDQDDPVHLNKCTGGESLLVCVGEAGQIFTSQDGEQWTYRSFTEPEWSKAVRPSKLVFGNGIFVAIGGSSEVAVSPDGVTWTVADSGAEEGFSVLAFGNGIFVAMGPYGRVATSSDGINWTLHFSGFRNSLIRDLTFGNGVFAAVNNAGTILTSSDGVSWMERISTDFSLEGIAYGNGIFMAAGAARSCLLCSGFDCSLSVCGGAVLTSPDGISWTVQIQIDDGLGPFSGLAFGNGKFISVWGKQVYATSDGRDWQGAMLDSTISALGFGNGCFIASNYWGNLFRSTDGLSWTRTYSSGDSDFRVAFGNDLFLAIGSCGTTLSSTDGNLWTLVRRGRVFKGLKDVTYGNGTFVIVGTGGFIFTSEDGIEWSEQQSGTNAGLLAVEYGNGRFVAAGYEGTILVSSDARRWDLIPAVASSNLSVFNGVAFGNDTFVICGDRILLSSDDGSSWSPAPVPHFWFEDVTFGNGLFVAVGSSFTVDSSGAETPFNRIATSPDGLTWTLRSLVTGYGFLKDVHFAKGIFVAAGYFVSIEPSFIMSSVDGISWSLDPIDIRLARSITSFADTFFVLGSSGSIYQTAILQSDPVSNREFIPFLAVDSTEGSLTVSSDGSFSPNVAETFSIKASLWTPSSAGTFADWWLLADTPFGWYYYVYPGQWHPLLSIENISPAYQGPLFTMGSLQIEIPAVLPAGRYTFYFGADLLMNGIFDSSRLYYDNVTVEIGAANS